ncbi:hypothetical protein HII31_09352 [Pseudocercospora fuligena]|uniref:C2H2-type domain-containing protein n=1 Tax=Pseudocercospora fuligena TaxID=685502 RepID=A0A8H6VIL1_9PEZI|nr:hypothetical protein HII31_09352 [Pseudocercospora fuligena]
MSLDAAGLLQMASIQQATQNVFHIFLGLNPELQSTFQVQIVDAEVRFRIWAANIGAHHSQKDPRSADQKLRNATQIKTRITQILEELVETLEDLQSILCGDREAQSVDDADAGELDQSLTAPRTEEQEILLSVEDLTSSLLEVSAFVHRTQGRNRVAYAKAATKHSSFTSEFDIAHVAHKCPKLESQPKLLKKLGEAITQRRQFLTYARDHHDKIAADAVATTLDRVQAQADEQPGTLHPDIKEATTSYSRPTEALTKNTSIHSADIDEVKWARLGGVDNNDATSEASSFMSSLPDEHEVEAAKIPELTTVCNEPGQPFECPLCYAIVAFKTQHSWRKHVFSDLRAYVCTNTECDSGLFESREAWLQHEQDMHNRDWHCPQCQYRGIDREDILSHILASHAKQWSDQFLLEPMINAASAIKQGFEAANCHFCDAWGERIQANRRDSSSTPVIVPARRFLRHLAQHMEQLALFALPLLEGNEDEGESAEDASNVEHALAEIDAEGADDDDAESDSDDADKVPTGQQLVDESPALQSTTLGRPQSRSSTTSKHSYLSKREGHAFKDELPPSSNDVAFAVYDDTGRKIDKGTDRSGSSIASSTDDYPPYPLPNHPLSVTTPEPNCAICGAPPIPECPHEGERLELALGQAIERWAGFQAIRDWALNHARNQVISTFKQLRTMRMEAHRDYLESLPYYTLYRRYNGHPPLQPAQIQLMNAQLNQANTVLQQGVDQDWRTSCLRYPEMLDYYLDLAELKLPSEKDERIADPRFGSGRLRSERASNRHPEDQKHTSRSVSPQTNRSDTSASIRDGSAKHEAFNISTNGDRVVHVHPDRLETEASWSAVESLTGQSADKSVEKSCIAPNVKEQASPLPSSHSPRSGTNADDRSAELVKARESHEKVDGKEVHDWAWNVHAAVDRDETVSHVNTNDHHSEASAESKDVQISVGTRAPSLATEDSRSLKSEPNIGDKGAEVEQTKDPFSPLPRSPGAVEGPAHGRSYPGDRNPDSAYYSTFDPSSYAGNPFAPGPTNNANTMVPSYGYHRSNYFAPAPGWPPPNPFAHIPPYPYPSGATGRYLLSKSASLARHGDKVNEDVTLLLRVSGAYKQARIEANYAKVSNSPVVNRKERVVEDIALLLNVGRAYRS